ncbi:hypothetical protein Tco_1493980 [Tanacetum coccineum]
MINGVVQLQALVDGKKIIVTEASIRSDLQLDDADGMDCLSNATIFEELTRMGYENISQRLTFYKAFFSPQWKFLIHTILQCLSATTTAWNEFSRTMASAIICLATNQKFNFSKYIFDSMVKNVDSVGFFLMNMKREGKGFSRRVTPLFPTMMVQAQEEIGEGSTNPTDPYHTPIITQPSTSQPQKKHKPRKPKKKDTQSSGPTYTIAQDTIAQTGFENVSKTSNDPLLSGEDSIQLKELMDFYTKLQQRVLNLENTKTGQAQEITISSEESLGEEDASKQGRKIDNIDADEGVTLVDETVENQGRFNDEEMFDTGVLNDEEVFTRQDVAEKEVSTADPVTTAGEVVTTASVEVSTASPIADELTLAQTLIEIKNKGKGIMEEPEKPSKKKDQIRLDEELAFKLQAEEEKEERPKRAEAKRNIPPTKAQQRSFMCTYLKNMDGWKPKDLKNKSFANIQDLFDKAMKRVNTFVDMETELVEGEELESDKSKKQKLDKKVEAEVDDVKEAEELKQCLEIVPDDGDDVTIDATPLFVKILIMLKNFDRKDLEVLWRIVKARFKKTEPVNYIDTFLHLNLKTMFEHHVEDSIWKNQHRLVKVLNWKLFDSCGVHYVTVQSIPYYLLVEKMYPLTKHTLHQMFNDVKLQVDYECKMTYELLRLVKKQLKEGYVPE